MNIKSKIYSDINIGGFLKVIREDPITGKHNFVASYNNVTITAYKTRILQTILSSVAPTDIIPLTMEVGTGTNVANAADTSLQTLLLSKSFNNIPVISGNSIVYEIRLEVSEANSLITEVGLKTSDNQLVARVNTSINKTSLDILILQFTKSLL